MKSGICPKCQTPTVYCKLGGISYGGGGTYVHTYGGGRRSDVYYYVCTDCGLLEAYLADEEKLAEVAVTWRKIIK